MALTAVAQLSVASFQYVLESSGFPPVRIPIQESRFLQSFSSLLSKPILALEVAVKVLTACWSLPCYNRAVKTSLNQSASSMCWDLVRWRGIPSQRSVSASCVHDQTKFWRTCVLDYNIENSQGVGISIIHFNLYFFKTSGLLTLFYDLILKSFWGWLTFKLTWFNYGQHLSTILQLCCLLTLSKKYILHFTKGFIEFRQIEWSPDQYWTFLMKLS